MPARATRGSWVVLCILGLVCTADSRADVDHSTWNALLERHVDEGGRVDYGGFAEDRSAVDSYLASLAAVEPGALGSDAARKAFWINAYNVATVRGVLDHLPVTSVRSIEGFFDEVLWRIAGADLTLNEIEARGRALGDWRVHFAVVCASVGCPSLRAEAYVPAKVEAQLTEQTRAFLADSDKGLRLDGATLWLSRIFEWYSGDFVEGQLTAPSLLPILEPYLESRTVRSIRKRRPAVRFLEYDWALNGTSAASR